MKRLLSLFAIIFAITSLYSQTARIQAIHNSADAAADTVDVYLTDTSGSILLVDDFIFRTSTPFIDAPAMIPITLSIAGANSSSIADTISGLSSTYMLMANETYILVADGIVSSSGYSPNQPFELNVYGLGRESASTGGNTDVLVHHGSTDAPIVDVRERTAGVLVDNAAYGDFSNYLELMNADYTLDVQDSSGSITVASYSAPLSTLGLSDSALVVVASGFLDPAQNSNGPGFGLFVALPSGGNMIPLPTVAGPTARVQVIHNSADAAADSVDIYLDGAILLDNFAFRNATPFVELPATKEIEIAVAPKNSTSVADSIPGAVYNYNLAIDEQYILVAHGLVSTSGYFPLQPFAIDVFPMARIESTFPGNVDFLLHHGATDAPAVDVRERVAATIVDNLAYSEFEGYLVYPTLDYTFDIQDSSGTTTLASYDAPFASLQLLDTAMVVVASGFLDPGQNSNGPGFGLFVALPTGGELLELPAATGPIARAQVIHNSADAAADSVDVYLDGTILLDNFAFRTASQFVDIPATKEIEIAVAPSSSNSVADSIPGAVFNYNLAIGETYILIADGIVSTSGYNPSQPFTLNVYPMAREVATVATNTDVLVHHGSTDAPCVDVVESSAGELVNNACYGDFAGYLELATSDYTIAVQDTSQMNTLFNYSVPLSTLNLDGEAITVLASGFVDSTQNSDGPSFGLYVALANGGALVRLPEAPISSIEELDINEFSVFPNPADNTITIRAQFSDDHSIEVFDMLGNLVINKIDMVDNLVLDISELKSGIYIMNVSKNGNALGYSRFVKN